MGSPPPIGSKNVVFRFRSVKSIVIAAARTGNDNNSKIVVIITDQTNNGTRSALIPLVRILIIVEIKFNEPKIEEAPAICSEKIAISTDGPEWDTESDRGGYRVQPAPTPPSIIDELNNIIIEGGNSQNLRLFRRGKDISTAPTINGRSQLPKPPIRIGITIKKIITNP